MDTKRLGLNVDRCLAHLQILRGVEGLAEKVRKVFDQQYPRDEKQDPELALYSGFLPDADKRLLREVRQSTPQELAQRKFAFRDPRYAELLFRYRARNWPETLDAGESERWDAFCKHRIETETPLTVLTRDTYFSTIAAMRQDPAQADKHVLLDALEDWGRRVE